MDTLARQAESQAKPDHAHVAVLRGAEGARRAAQEWFVVRAKGVVFFWLAMLLLAAGIVLMVRLIRVDGMTNPAGEPFSFTNGVSAWPAQIIRFLVWALGLSFVATLFLHLRGGFFELSRKYRIPALGIREALATTDRGTGDPVTGRASILSAWRHMYDGGRFQPRVNRAAGRAMLYFLFGLGIILLSGLPASPVRGALLADGVEWPFYCMLGLASVSTLALWTRIQWRTPGSPGAFRLRCPARGEWCWQLVGAFWLVVALTLVPGWFRRGDDGFPFPSLDTLLVWAAITSFTFLAFMAIDAAGRCREFILAISFLPTEYPESTRQHFARSRAMSTSTLMDEWIDVQLIADLTERLSAILWMPSILALLLLFSRSSWWDGWTWTPGLVVIMTTNFLLVLLGVLVVQRSAREAKAHAEGVLAAKVRQAQAKVAPTPAAHQANEAAQLLEEIQSVRRGAFVGFWENPVIGALLLPSGGTVVLEIALWALGK